jgi:hypothetical protein
MLTAQATNAPKQRWRAPSGSRLSAYKLWQALQGVPWQGGNIPSLALRQQALLTVGLQARFAITHETVMTGSK